MAVYIEALILYIILFFSGSGSAEGISSQIMRILLFFIPSIALIWYLLSRNWKIEYWIVRPRKKDLFAALITFPVLLATGSVIALISSITSGSAALSISSPDTFAGWLVLCISIILAAYLEESFFRFYLLSKRKEMNLSSPAALALSTALFAVCHIYEGPWGFLNAVISGLFLGFVFLRYNTFHGIAIAHGLYNITAYVINAVF
ncbi:MAG: CPBP family intramembrane metalloprotease [Treponema sp.]|nr:CPBP family intramembrane metalloprotease [Treponema sp.]